jgi:isocitrate dehydrogenase kinase/phosphatase
MCVFTLPSYPYVFKVIRDHISPSKDVDAARVMQKYALVKHHDRAGRMTDTLEYSNVAIPRDRFTDELMAELEDAIPLQLEHDADHVIIRHVYIERRLAPLNLYLRAADDGAKMRAVRDYGNAIKELAAINIFAGDLLFKNFGVTRYGRVVFYDYDEIEYLTDCRFRTIPQAPEGMDDMSSEVWYPVGPHDIFPEEFATFLLTDPGVRQAFLAFHADLLDARWWQAMQDANRDGRQIEVLSYPESVRFRRERTRQRGAVATR